MMDEKKLDNPVWYSLSETHKNFAVDFGNIKFYQPDLCPFGGFIETENISNPISEYAKLTDNFFIVGQKPILPNNSKLKNELVCNQMVIYNKINLHSKEEIIELTDEDNDKLFHLLIWYSRDILKQIHHCWEITSAYSKTLNWLR